MSVLAICNLQRKLQANINKIFPCDAAGIFTAYIRITNKKMYSLPIPNSRSATFPLLVKFLLTGPIIIVVFATRHFINNVNASTNPPPPMRKNPAYERSRRGLE